ncbi:MAG: response regulator [Rhodospirillales bacterium]
MSEGKQLILNIDSDEGGREELTRILRQAGFDVIEAGSGEEGLQRAKERPSLILLDVNLPDMHGLEVCRRIKTDPETRWIPVLQISALSISSKDQAAALEGGADAYLTAPVTPDLLVATIRALLRTSRAEAEAREAARLWEITFNSISHGVFLVNAEGRVTRINRAMAEMLGRPAQELIGLTTEEMFAGVPPPVEGWPLERARQTQHRESAEFTMNGCWFILTADPIIDSDGRFTGAVRTLIDITEQKLITEERKRLMRQLEGERGRLQEILRQMPAGVLIAAAPSGEIVLSNEQADRILRGAVQETPTRHYHHPGGGPYSVDELPLMRSLTTGEIVSGEEVEVVHSDGSRATCLVSSAPVRDSQGFIVAAVATLHDVTERMQLEQQLRQAQKMEAIGRLAGGVAHDFNNLLTIISGYAQMLYDSLGPQDAMRRDVEPIIEAANRAAVLTRQLLTFSRRQIVQPRLLDVNRQVSRMNRMLRRVIGEDVELITSLKSGQSSIKADPGQLEQVILNLAINARDAMPHGGKLTIETAEIEIGNNSSGAPQELAPGRYVVLALSDTGVGMDAEVKSHLFEPFFTTKGKGKGTGLGLSTVYGIVKQCHGEIVIDSEVGRGTTVRIYFPVAEVPGRRHHEVESQSTAAGKGTETILLVEDEEEVRRLAREMLARQGYRVIEAGSGAEAMRIWHKRRGSIDMLLTDVVMPRMSGRELADKMRESRPDLKVMYMSGYTDDVIARHGVLDSGTAFLSKPFTSEALSRKVRSVLDEKSKKAN